MAKRAAETKEGYPCFLTPSLLADQSPGAVSEQVQATVGEAEVMTNGQNVATYCTVCVPTAWQQLSLPLSLHFTHRQQNMKTEYVQYTSPSTNGQRPIWSPWPWRKLSFTSALSHIKTYCSLLSTLCHICPSLPFFSVSDSLSSLGKMYGLLHICKWITLFCWNRVCVCEL